MPNTLLPISSAGNSPFLPQHVPYVALPHAMPGQIAPLAGAPMLLPTSSSSCGNVKGKLGVMAVAAAGASSFLALAAPRLLAQFGGVAATSAGTLTIGPLVPSLVGATAVGMALSMMSIRALSDGNLQDNVASASMGLSLGIGLAPLLTGLVPPLLGLYAVFGLGAIATCPHLRQGDTKHKAGYAVASAALACTFTAAGWLSASQLSSAAIFGSLVGTISAMGCLLAVGVLTWRLVETLSSTAYLDASMLDPSEVQAHRLDLGDTDTPTVFGISDEVKKIVQRLNTADRLGTGWTGLPMLTLQGQSGAGKNATALGIAQAARSQVCLTSASALQEESLLGRPTLSLNLFSLLSQAQSRAKRDDVNVMVVVDRADSLFYRPTKFDNLDSLGQAMLVPELCLLLAKIAPVAHRIGVIFIVEQPGLTETMAGLITFRPPLRLAPLVADDMGRAGAILAQNSYDRLGGLENKLGAYAAWNDDAHHLARTASERGLSMGCLSAAIHCYADQVQAQLFSSPSSAIDLCRARSESDTLLRNFSALKQAPTTPVIYSDKMYQKDIQLLNFLRFRATGDVGVSSLLKSIPATSLQSAAKPSQIARHRYSMERAQTAYGLQTRRLFACATGEAKMRDFFECVSIGFSQRHWTNHEIDHMNPSDDQEGMHFCDLNLFIIFMQSKSTDFDTAGVFGDVANMLKHNWNPHWRAWAQTAEHASPQTLPSWQTNGSGSTFWPNSILGGG